MRDPTTPRVFVSYSRTDGLEFARRLQTALETEDLSLYRDLHDLVGGEDWWRQVEAAIRSVEHVVLVLSPAALRSPYVAREWKLARQEGKKVSPVSGPGALDFSQLPRWMARAHRHDIDIPESLARLVQVLKGPAGEKRVPFMADALPEGFVARPEEFDRLKRSLLDARGEPVAITAALRGAGGYGKTALANALCHDSDVQEAFSDGILRITLGEKPADLVGSIADLIETLVGERPAFRDIDPAKVALVDALDDRRCLLVIDDAWRAEDLAPLLYRGLRNQTTRLVTTRDDRVVPREVPRIAVDAMQSGEAQAMLSRGMPPETAAALRPRLASLAGRLGEWPLVLGLANGVVRTRMSRGATVGDALAYVERAIVHRGLAQAFTPDERASRRLTAWGTLEVSLEQLRTDERARFAELAVFVEDAEIPTSVALGLWRQTAALDPLDGEDLLVRLADLSLLVELDLGRGVLRLHDVVRTLLRDGPIAGRLSELDRLLVTHYREANDGDLAALRDVYGLRHLMAHLNSAGELQVARGLLTDPAWLANKLHRLGIQPLLADYATLSHRDATLDLVRGSLSLAAPALARNAGELAQQLLARLAPGDAKGLDKFLAHTRRLLVRPTLVPHRPTFTPPGAELRRYEGHEESVTSVTVLADGRRALSGSRDRTLRLWDLDTGAELRRYEGHSEWVTSVTVLADGRRALSGYSDGALRLWDLETGAELRRFEGHDNVVTSATVLADGRRALSASADWTLRLWDLESGAQLHRFDGHEDWVASVAVHERYVLSGSSDRTLRLWDLETGVELRRFEGHEGMVTSVTVLAGGGRALSGSWDRTLRLWDLETGAELRRFAGHDNGVTSVTVLADGRRALSASEDRTLRLWDLDTGAELRRFESHAGPVTSVTAMADGRRAISASWDRTLRLWDLEAMPELPRFGEHEDRVSSLAVLADGRRALSGSWDRTLRLWDLETGVELRRLEAHQGLVTSVTVLADGRRALSASDDQTLRLWDLETGTELRRFEGDDRGGNCITVLPGGRSALLRTDGTFLSDGTTLLLSALETGVELRRFEGHEGKVTSVAVSADGRRALSGYSDGTLRLWDLETGAELGRFGQHEGWVTSVTVLADGRRALSASEDRTLRLWDLDMGVELHRFAGHRASINSVTVLADGRRALSASETLRLWDLETGVELRRFEGHEGMVTSVTVLAGGGRALSTSDDQTLRLWDLETGVELARLTFDALPYSLAWSSQRGAAVVGDARGRVHVIDLIE